MGWYPTEEERHDPNWRPDVDDIIELGNNHFLMPMHHEGRITAFTEWHQERGINRWHGGTLPLQYPGDPKVEGTTWDVDSLEPLTLSPSVACGCGVHGFIRSGRWVDA